jgi:hypothetical protein
MGEIEIYVWGDPKEKEDKVWTVRAKLLAAALIGLAAGYLWAIMQAVE